MVVYDDFVSHATQQLNVSRDTGSSVSSVGVSSASSLTGLSGGDAP